MSLHGDESSMATEVDPDVSYLEFGSARLLAAVTFCLKSVMATN